MADNVNHPGHYNAHPSGVECITVTEHMNFCLGNAMKYIWRADHKNGSEDLEKAIWYLQREIKRRASVARDEGFFYEASGKLAILPTDEEMARLFAGAKLHEVFPHAPEDAQFQIVIK